MRATLHLVDLIDVATIEAPGPRHVEPRQLHVGEDSRAGLFQHPPSVVRLPLPAWARDGRLETAAGVTNAVVGRIGGPVRFRIGIARGPGADVAWLTDEVVDARSEPSGWVSMSAAFDGAHELVLATEALDASHAWVGWADPVVRASRAAPAPRRRGRPSPPGHVLLVTADALRADHVLHDAVRTPRLDALRAEGAIAFAAGPGRVTSRAARRS